MTLSDDTLSTTVFSGNLFVLRYSPVSRGFQRRQGGSSGFVGGDNSTVCTDAAVYSIINGQLYQNNQVYSASPGVAYEVFAPLPTQGNITTTFSVLQDGSLIWTNGAFFNGAAQFCVFENGTLVAVFQDGTSIAGCFYVLLETSECKYDSGWIIWH